MRIPAQVPVMTLPGATLFPQALLPLYIFEPRYRRMLKDMLATDRMFSVAMQRPGTTRESPCPIAGLGLIRVSVDHEDGTSHLVLQGLTRVHLKRAVQYRPYRVHSIRPMQPQASGSLVADALLNKLLDLVRTRLELGQLPVALPMTKSDLAGPQEEGKAPAGKVTEEQVIRYLENLEHPERVADMVACSILSDAGQRQTILETLPLEQRLKQLMHFLIAEIESLNKNEAP